jgi:S-DNA-T family DNA segregation ATPase FtsK/SpoIIIE
LASKSRGRASGRGAARARTSVRQHLAPWARDALGIGLVVLGLLAVLGLWFEAAGPVGRGLDWALHGSIGLAAVAFPVIAVYWGVLLLRDTAEDTRVRMFIGFAISRCSPCGAATPSSSAATTG